MNGDTQGPLQSILRSHSGTNPRNYLGEHMVAVVLGRDLCLGLSAVDGATHTESKTWLLVLSQVLMPRNLYEV